MDYAIKNTTLTAMADAIRNKGKGYYPVEEVLEPDYVLSFKINDLTPIKLDDYGQYSYSFLLDMEEILGNKAKYTSYLRCEYLYEATAHNVARYFSFSVEGAGNYHQIIGDTTSTLESGEEYYPYFPKMYLTCSAYKNKLEAGLEATFTIRIRAVDGSRQCLKLNTLTPLEMVEAIKEINGVPSKVFNITTLDMSNCFSVGNWKYLLEAYPEQFKLRTENIDNADNCFKGCNNLVDLSKLKMAGTSRIVNSPTKFYDAFNGCGNLEHLPTFTTVVDFTHTMRIFYDCHRLRELNFTPNFSGHFQYNAPIKDKKEMFNSCYSLRKIPGSLFTNSNNYNSTPSSYQSSYWFENSCYGCYTLDELLDIPLPTKYTFSINIFKNFVSYCYRAKDLTFETNEDGTPIVWKFTNQTLDLSTYGNIGTNNKTNISKAILEYNSGITADKEVYDDATYQALKNDDDWFSYSNDYARYNHDSAVRTIASLPDNSATGTNTIKFRGNAGALTDGGAINTLTEEEIAVAVAKGWTVSFV